MSPSVSPSVWRNRDFLLVLGGGLVNNIGDWLLVVALPAFVYTETGSGRSTAAIVVIELVVGIAFGPLGGSLVDGWNLRRTIIVTNIKEALPPVTSFLFTILREKKDGFRIELQPGDHWFQDLINAHHPGDRPAVTVSSDDKALFQYSGGTTGVP